jgi:hypothetical protein
MSNYKLIISKQDTSFFAVFVRIEKDGEEVVVQGKFYASEKRAEKAFSKFLISMS